MEREANEAARARLTVAPDAEAMSERAVEEIAAAIDAALAERRIAHLALSGGATPVEAYELLAERVSDWRGVEIWFADERCVGPEDAESNYRLVAQSLVSRARARRGSSAISNAQVQRMQGELGPWRGAHRYAELLRSRVAAGEDGIPELDAIVLGIGPEGHIASIFPASSALQERDALCIGIADSPKPPPERISLSMPVLRAGRRSILLVSGASKARALAAALAAPSRTAPASLLARGRLTVIADEAAAAALAPRTG